MKFKSLYILILLTVTVFSLFSNSVYAGNEKNDSSSTVLKHQIARNLDSLLAVYYVKKAIANEIAVNNNTDSLSIGIPEFNDSLIELKLKNMPMVFDMAYNDRVKSFINLYVNKRRRQVSAMLGLSKYYFNYFEECLDKHNMPLELKYLPVIESALNPRAVSRAGAVGLWQFMYPTGKLYGLKIGSYVDERRDPIKSTNAAVNYLKDLYEIYNDWTLVIAAYNCGPGNVNKAIRRSGGSTNYWDIYYRLPRETRGYVPAFIAAAYTFENYEEFNYVPKKMDFPIATDTVHIVEELHLKQVAEVMDVPVQLLKDINPQYRRDIIPNTEDTFALILPVEYTTKFIDLQDSILAYKDSVFFPEDDATIKKSKTYSSRNYVPDPPSKDMEAIYYTIKSGDNLGFISSWYNVRIKDLRYWNNLYGNTIRAGKKLVVYKKKSQLAKYKKINSMSFAQKQKMIGKTVEKSSSSEKKTTTNSSKSGDYVYYKVRSGDNFWTIARKYPGISNTDIMELNNIKNERSLKPGQLLKIKPK